MKDRSDPAATPHQTVVGQDVRRAAAGRDRPGGIGETIALHADATRRHEQDTEPELLTVALQPVVQYLGPFVADIPARCVEGRLPRASDADGDTITYLVATAPRGGTLTINTDGRFFCQSRAGISGSDSFGFAVSDGMGGSSTYTVTVNLTPVTGQRVGTSGADTLGPATAAEGYTGLGGRDTFTGSVGNDFIDGGDGIDTAKYDGARSRYPLERADTHWLHTDRNGGDGADRLVAVERIEYSNAKVAIDLDGNAGIPGCE